MNFIDKLISDTLNGDWDYAWIWSNDKYTFKVAKHPMSGMNFQIEYGGKKNEVLDEQVLVFPNGFGNSFSKDKMLELQEAITVSLERTVVDSKKNYLNPPIVEETTNTEPTTTKSDITTTQNKLGK